MLIKIIKNNYKRSLQIIKTLKDLISNKFKKENRIYIFKNL